MLAEMYTESCEQFLLGLVTKLPFGLMGYALAA